MQIILLERVKNLGLMGDVVNVKPGFARNFLLPQKKALRATENNLQEFKKRKAQLEADNLQNKKEAEAVAAKMDGLSLIMIRNAGESGQLYGSVTAKDIADEMIAKGIKVSYRQVTLNKPIKMVGIHKSFIVLHPEVEIEVGINIAMSQDEAEAQAKGIDVIAEKKKTQQKEATETASLMGAAGSEEEDSDVEKPKTKKRSSKKDPSTE